MLNYVNDIAQIWECDAMKLFLTRIGISMYPILATVGGEINAPIAIIVENEDVTKTVFRELSGYNSPQVVSLGMSKKEFEKCVASASYELFPILCNGISDHNYINLEILKNTMISKKIKGKLFNSLPVIAFCGVIPSELAGSLAGKIHVKGKKVMKETINNEKVTRKIIKSLMDNWSTIEHKVRNLNWEGGDNFHFMKFAEEACKVFFEREKEMNPELYSKLIKDIEKAMKDLETGWEIASNYEAWIELLQERIFKETKFIFRIINRKKASRGEILLLDRYPIFDSQYYYFTTDFFDKICSDILYVEKSELKKALCAAGILVGEGNDRSYYSVKVPVTTNAGVIVTSRRLRIKRNWLDLPGELTWQEKIEMKRRQ